MKLKSEELYREYHRIRFDMIFDIINDQIFNCSESLECFHSKIDNIENIIKVMLVKLYNQS